MYFVYCLQFELSLTFISDSYRADNCLPKSFYCSRTLSSMRRTYWCLHPSFPSLRPVVYSCLQIGHLCLSGRHLFVLLSYIDSREPGKQDINNASEISQNKSHIPHRHVLVKKIISMVKSSFAVPLQRATISNSHSTRNKGQINTADFPITRYKLILNFVKWTINPWPYFTYRVWLKRFAVPTSCSRSWVDRHSIMLNETSVPASSFFAWERNNCFPQFPNSIPTSLANKMLTMHQR